MKKVLFTCFFLLGCSHHGHHHHRFDDAEHWAKIFEDQKRISWQKPMEVIKKLGITKSSIVADIGSATGFFPVRIAKIAKRGRVWGVDIEPNLVRFLNDRAQKERIKNLYSILGTYSDPLLPEKVDVILIVNTYHHIEKRKVYFKNLKRYLKPNAIVAIIDLKKGDLPFGPKDEMKISGDQIINEMTLAGFEIDTNDNKLLEYQNLLIFTSKSLEKDCLKKKDGEACLKLGLELFKKYNTPMPASYSEKKEVFKVLDLGCEYGNGNSCYEAGRFHLYVGFNKKKDNILGEAYIKRGCKLKHKPSCDFLNQEFKNVDQ